MDNKEVMALLQKAKEKIKGEAYIAIITDIQKQVNFYVTVPSRKDLSEMLAIMPTDRYALYQLQTIYSYKEYKDFKNDLIFGGDNKVKGLFFGNEKPKKKNKKKGGKVKC